MISKAFLTHNDHKFLLVFPHILHHDASYFAHILIFSVVFFSKNNHFCRIVFSIVYVKFNFFTTGKMFCAVPGCGATVSRSAPAVGLYNYMFWPRESQQVSQLAIWPTTYLPVHQQDTSRQKLSYGHQMYFGTLQSSNRK